MSTHGAASVREAAAALVAAFGSNDVEAYFACFRPDATFLFHTADRLLTSREEYRRLWDDWVRVDDFRIVDCTTTATHLQEHGDSAVLTHDVRTTVSSRGGEDVLLERETIVFHREDDGRWLAVHEHLSPAPHSGSPGPHSEFPESPAPPGRP
jgi:ketosteroid isomerase-like protein